MNKILFIALLSIVSIITGCPTATAPGGNSNSATNSATNVTTTTPANLPPEFSNTPQPPNANSTPGIPSSVNMNNVPKGATPTPGIPSEQELKKPFKPGATPTPGIPDPKTLKDQMNKTLNNANVVQQLPKTQKDAEKTVNDVLKTVRKKP
ncbi:MAG: hypothetical protein JSS81_04755 [Acidobacteria bacterium]|nr:hypothetical protein [Acidobacteriota bacterium]